ncbi:hypothetical protein [Lysinibacillus xylanilyticus]|nr:hypothetical protein [Lysinibacillus xylanilyticus]
MNKNKIDEVVETVENEAVEIEVNLEVEELSFSFGEHRINNL